MTQPTLCGAWRELWLLVYAAMLAFGGIPRTITGLALPILRSTYAVPIFAAIALALVIGSWRTTKAPKVHPAP